MPGITQSWRFSSFLSEILAGGGFERGKNISTEPFRNLNKRNRCLSNVFFDNIARSVVVNHGLFVHLVC